MRRVVLIVPGDINTRTGGFIYDKRIAEGLRALGWCVDVRPGDLASLPDGTTTVIDGLALLGLDDQIDRHLSRIRTVALIHLPLALEVGLDREEAARRDALEQRALRSARLVVATGRVTVDELTRRGVEQDRIALVEPGTDRASLARGSSGGSVALLAVAALTPGKGHERLLRALAAARPRNWMLTCAGSLDRDPATARRVRALIHDLDLMNQVALAGELDDRELADAYDRSDVFVLATVRETFGMAVAEAVARGLPVISTSVGAIPDIVGDGGLLVAPDDEAALGAVLTRAIESAAVRADLAAGARAARERLRTWAEASQTMADALARIDVDG